MGFAGAYLRLARPKQWTKNGFVLAGLVFAEQAFVASSVTRAVLAFAAFCLLSGAVYAANDVLDVEEDRKHPLKRRRPVASGLISPRSATVYAAILAAGGLALAFAVHAGVGLAGLAYLALQALYIFFLKHIAILDVMSIAAGFVIRAFAGVVAVNIMLSATIIAYTLYTFTVYESEDEMFMMASIPFVVYGVFRYMLLVHRDGGGNPDTLLLKDRPLQITLLLWLAVVMFVIYFL